MRSAKDDNNSRLFRREEWLTKTQVKGFFSRLAAARRRCGNEDIDLNDAYAEEEEEEERRSSLLILPQSSARSIQSLTDLCKCVKEDKLEKFNATMRKTILLHFDVAFNSQNRKKLGLDAKVVLFCSRVQLLLER